VLLGCDVVRELAQVPKAGCLMSKVGTFLATSSVAVAAVMGASTGSIRDEVNPPIKLVGLEAHDSHAAASILGQFRTSASSWLFLHADLYLHNGVEMRPLTDDEIKRGRKGVGSNPNEQKLHNDAKIVTVVPSARDDFRGIFGDVERTTTSYKDMTGHSHNKPTDSLPLFRLMTLLDPQFVQGWTTGSYIMLWDKSEDGFHKALAFLQEGLKHNPKSIDILTEIAASYLKERNGTRDFDSAIPYLRRARTVAAENFEHLSEEEREATLKNYRRLAVSLRELQLLDEERAVVIEGRKFFPEDIPLDRFWRVLNGEIVSDAEINPPSVIKPVPGGTKPASEIESKDAQQDSHQEEAPVRVKVRFI